LDELARSGTNYRPCYVSIQKLGYSDNWINQRLKSIEIRKELTDEWRLRGMKEGQQFATLTDIITETWAGKTPKITNT